MAYSFTWGYDPSTITTKNIAVDTIVPSTYVVTTQQPDEVTESNLSSPLGRIEKFTFGRRSVKDIYANSTSIDPTYRSPSKSGIKVLVNWESVASLTNTENPTFRMDFPISSRLTVTVPASDYLTADNVLMLIKHHIGSLYGDSTDVTSARLAKLLKGALPL